MGSDEVVHSADVAYDFAGKAKRVMKVVSFNHTTKSLPLLESGMLYHRTGYALERVEGMRFLALEEVGDLCLNS